MQASQDRSASMKFQVLALAVAAALMPCLASAQTKEATTAELKQELAKMQAQMLEQQKAMQQMQQRLSELESGQAAQAAAPAAVAAQAQPVTQADIPQHEPASNIHAAVGNAGRREPPPSKATCAWATPAPSSSSTSSRNST